MRLWRAERAAARRGGARKWWQTIDHWRARKSFGFRNSTSIIKPQHAIQRLYELTKGHDVYITTEVGQHRCGRPSTSISTSRTDG